MTTGLTSAEAAARLARDGPNELVPRGRGAGLRMWFQPLRDPLVVLLLIAIPVYVAIGDAVEAIVVAVLLIPVVAVGTVLEVRAERSLEELRRLTARVTRVVRDGRETTIPASDLVAGDVMMLHEGDIVPADGQLLELTELHVDEASLTGESLPIAKTPGDAVLAGTTVLSGRASAVVGATGARTQYGAIGRALAETTPGRTPLQQAVNRLVVVFAIVGSIACVAVVATELAHGSGWGDAVIAGVALAIATVPEEFPLVYTLYLAFGARRLARDRALVRRLPSVETLGSTNVICTDKTGTLTYGRVSVAETWGDGVLDAAVLASEPQPFDPLDIALLDYARVKGSDVDALHGGSLVVDYPFDPAGKYVTHIWSDGAGACRIVAKGSFETLGRDAPEGARAAHDALAGRGMRVIAVAEGRLPGAPAGDRDADERALRFAGLVAFEDPVRNGVDAALDECRTAGVRVVVMTGDHPATAHALAESLHLPHGGGADGEDLIVTGDALDAAEDDTFDDLVARANVYARVRPEQKFRLVRALRKQGAIVAMTGDGINDAPALREADIGVAMGERGTEVAREAASMVLLDDNFSTIVGAVRDGRRIFENLRHAFAYLVAFHPALILAALVVPLLDKPLLLLPVQLLLLQFLLQPVVALVFEGDPADADVMQRPPRDPRRRLVGREMLMPLLLGLALGIATLGSYLIALDRWPADEARAFAFAVLLLGELGLLFVVRGRRPATPVLGVIVAFFAAVIVAAVEFEPLAHLLKLAAFPLAAWPVAVAIAAVSSGVWLLAFPSRVTARLST